MVQQKIKSAWTGITKVKDVIYIVSFIITVCAFFIKQGESKQKLEDSVKKLDKIEQLMQEQLVLNGKIIMYMQMDNHENSRRTKSFNRMNSMNETDTTMGVILKQQQKMLDTLKIDRIIN
jgi:uncharacterized membrane protein YjjP (DUF1212 family)